MKQSPLNSETGQVRETLYSISPLTRTVSKTGRWIYACQQIFEILILFPFNFTPTHILGAYINALATTTALKLIWTISTPETEFFFHITLNG